MTAEATEAFPVRAADQTSVLAAGNPDKKESSRLAGQGPGV